MITHLTTPVRTDRHVVIKLVLVLALAAATLVALPAPKAAAACTGNAVVCENQLTGTDPSVWDVDGAGDPTIQGFATQMSVNAGSTVSFKVNSSNKAFTVEIYRLGFYQGKGARKVATIGTGAVTVRTQPACAKNASTEIYDCGTWGISTSWAVPSTAVSGVYIARLIRTDTGGDSHIPFVVRNDGNTSQVLMQTSDSTWQAYNNYGGSDFYSGGNNGRAYKLSYNRPFATRGVVNGRDFLFSNEYPMIRFLESNGYDVSYVSGLDVTADPALLPKHKVFLSVGHDEYWNKDQRANVTAARDAGVNLAFFSGNEVYWKTRMEASMDGAATPARTLVTYKDTWASDDNYAVQLDPVEPTPTWRDPRFGNLGFGPENELTGVQFQANSDDLPLTVSKAEGKLRLWRNTALTSMTAASTKLAEHTVGYESDEDVDNGYRPAGLIRLSTTVGSTPEYLQDFGKNVAPGTTTHHLTMYRAPSGALVFGAGTVQWAWGLDSNHDGEDVQAADPAIQQATINILADMGAPATTVTGGLVATTASTDTTAPTPVITSPSNGATLTQGSLVTVTGTASDTGGQVAGVEVSVDGGATFHPATGTTSWSYTDILTGNGSGAIQVRATDDSSRTSAPVSISVTSPCPCSIFGVITPRSVDSADASDVTLGVKFTSSSAGYISGVRFYKSAANTGTHTGTLYTAGGTAIATGTFGNETASGWQTLSFSSPVAITANTTYVAAYYAPKGHYAADTRFFAGKSQKSGVLTAPGVSVANGVYADGSNFPDHSYQATNYYVDVMFATDDTAPTTVTSTTPAAGASSVATSSTVSATFSKAVTASSVSITAQDAANNAVPGSVSYNATTRTATFNPTQGLASSTTYTLTVAANGLAAPYQWTFRTADPPSPSGSCPCTLFDDADQPASGPDSDTVSVQLGMAFTASSNGQIVGGRFFKNVANQGVHTVALWQGGTKLATATVTNESTSGWQQTLFDNPVSITAGTTYVISYTAPQGRYGFTSNGLAAKITKGSLSSVAGGGRYTYGTGQLTGTSNANYFVDPVFSPSAAAAPTVVAVSPGNGATSVPVSDHVAITFSTPVQAGSATIAVKKVADGSTVTGTTTSEGQGAIANFVPSDDFLPGTAYSVTVSGAKNASGTVMATSSTTTFTTSGADACPCSLFETTTQPGLSDSEDTSAVTLGLRFTPSVSGFVKSLRYYRDAANSGNHTGKLWSSTGTSLGSVTFTNGAAGWQTANFASPIAVTAGTTYVASYYAPAGHYSADLNYFANPVVNTPLSSVSPGGVYANGDAFPSSTYMATNYYVDVVFTTNSNDPPSVTTVSPADNGTAAVGTNVTATFDRAISTGTLSFTLKTSAGAAVTGTTAYDASSRTVTFDPTADLAAGTAYTASVSASSAGGVAMTAPKTWTFTTGAPPPTGTAHSLFSLSDTPAVAAWDDAGPVTVGVKFSSANAGSVTAIRFYAGSGNTGGQNVYLWNSAGTQLATGTATGSGVGWRTVTLANPVAITANTTYTVGYNAPTGHYSVTSGTYGSAYSANTLTVPAGGAVYRYPSGFPSSTSSANYWVDVVVVS